MFSGVKTLLSMRKDIVGIIKEIPRQKLFTYGNVGTLKAEYFKAAKRSFKDPFVYIILSSTGSPMSNLVQFFTQNEFAHTSLAFDRDFETLVSYNSGNGLGMPGLNPEKLVFFCQKLQAKAMVYRLPATKSQKRRMLNEVKRINMEGSSYNVLGVLIKRTPRKNSQFCSQFVYNLLQTAHIEYFTKNSCHVEPIDFIEQNHDGKLQFVDELCLDELFEMTEAVPRI